MVATNNTNPANEMPENDCPFAEVAPLFQAWQQAESPLAPTLPPPPYDYARGLADGAAIVTEGYERLVRENRELRAHLRHIAYSAHVTRHLLMEPKRPRREMIELSQEIADRAKTLVSVPSDRWPRVDTGGIDSPRPFDTARHDSKHDAELHAAFDRWGAAEDALRELTTPTGPRTPGYQEHKAHLDAIRKAAVTSRQAFGDYMRLRAKYGE